MKKSCFTRCIAFLLFGSLLLIGDNIFAQTITLIPNPDEGTGFDGLAFRGGKVVLYNGELYGPYIDANGKGRLAKFNGTKITLFPNPNDEGGVFGSFVIFNNSIYCQYLKYASDPNYPLVQIGYIAKFDGKSLKVLSNPDQGRGFFVTSILTVFNNVGISAKVTQGFRSKLTHPL